METIKPAYGLRKAPSAEEPHAKSNLVTRMAKRLMRRRSPVNVYIRMNSWLWPRLPAKARNTKLMRLYGRLLHELVCRHSNRRQFAGTFFLRNRPELELICRLNDRKPAGSVIKIAVLGCSIGAEVYSILFAIRSRRPDLNVHICAVDNSSEVLAVAKGAVYTSLTSDFVGSSIFERMTEAEFDEIFERNGSKVEIRSWLKKEISWFVVDAADPELIRILGSQDIVVANNFLCHMEPREAERCLRNITALVKPGGHLFVTGIDLDVRAKVARDLDWHPVPDLISEIHEGDVSVRGDWPCRWWGLEPLDRERNDWLIRYATAFQLN
jgi:chemotaxis methyl-accepting protein methylase